MTKIYLGLGRDHSIRPGDVVGAIANETGLSGGAIGAIDIYDDYTLVDIPAADAPRVVSIMNGKFLRTQRVKAEIAQDAKNQVPRRRRT